MSEGNNISILNLSYVREVDNNNLLSSELEKTFNLPPHNPLLARRGKEKEVIIRDCHVASLLTMTLILFPFSTHATCTPTPDCASIGYTQTSCETKSVKCPFDTSKLFCIPCDSSFQYDCVGANIASGVGDSCGGKYMSCNCSSTDYIFSNGSCLCDTACKVGAIYYSDNTCSACLHNDKTPVGVVVKDNELVLSKDIVTGSWGASDDYVYDIPLLTNSSSAISDYLGKENTNLIVEYFGVEVNPTTHAGVYCYNYAPSEMDSSKGLWYLPASGELREYVFGNREKLKTIFIDKLGVSSYSRYLWSSSEVSTTHAWVVHSTADSTYSNFKDTADAGIGCFFNI